MSGSLIVGHEVYQIVSGAEMLINDIPVLTTIDDQGRLLLSYKKISQTQPDPSEESMKLHTQLTTATYELAEKERMLQQTLTMLTSPDFEEEAKIPSLNDITSKIRDLKVKIRGLRGTRSVKCAVNISTVKRFAVLIPGRPISWPIMGVAVWLGLTTLPTLEFKQELLNVVENVDVHVDLDNVTPRVHIFRSGLHIVTNITEYELLPAEERIKREGGTVVHSRNSAIIMGGSSELIEVIDLRTGRAEIKSESIDLRNHSAAEHAGVIYLTGGWPSDSPNNNPTRTVWRYEPFPIAVEGTGTQGFRSYGNIDVPINVNRMAYARYGHQSCVVAGALWIFGGYNSGDEPLAICEHFDLVSNEWSVIAPMPIALGFFGLTVIGNQIYICGGLNVSGNLSYEVFTYNIETNQWRSFERMVAGHARHTLVNIENCLIVVADEKMEYCNLYDRVWKSCTFQLPGNGNLCVVA